MDYHTLKSRAMDAAQEKAEADLAFASIGTNPLTGMTPAQREAVKAGLIHYARTGASAAIAFANLHGAICLKHLRQ